MSLEAGCDGSSPVGLYALAEESDTHVEIEEDKFEEFLDGEQFADAVEGLRHLSGSVWTLRGAISYRRLHP